MLGQASTVGRKYLGHIVITETGEYARGRLVFHEGSEHPGKIEIGMADGTTRMVTPGEITKATDYPIEMRAIPVHPDAADGSSRPTGVCENEECGITANVITIVDTKSARYSCGEWYMKRPDRFGRSVKAPTKTICTHCYAATGA